MRLTLYGFSEQYKSLYRAARFGSGAKAGYALLAKVLDPKDHNTLFTARSAVQARLVSLGREVNATRGGRQAFLLDQIAVLEHFLEESKRCVD